jgi:dihydropteroate synthase
MSVPVWHCGRHRLALDRPIVMGIVNVTPDSFSDGGRFADTDDAVEHALAMFAEGAGIVDVGGESTRPGAAEVSVEEETSRVLPVVSALAKRTASPVSIDTRHAEVASACLDAGASIVNDVWGFRDPAMVEVVADSDCGCIVMHMQGEPRTMQADPTYDDVVAEVGDFLRERASVLEDAGVARVRIAIDPGIGFGKTAEHNLELLRRLPQLVDLGYPVVVGASRKSFIGAVLDIDEPADRLAGSLGVAVHAAVLGATVLRVHDVRETVDALRMSLAIGSSTRGAPPVGGEPTDWIPLRSVGAAGETYVPTMGAFDADGASTGPALDLLFAETVLEQDRIPSMFTPHRPFEGHDPYGFPADVRLMVPASRHEEAERLVAEALRARHAEREDDGEDGGDAAAGGAEGDADRADDREGGDETEE